MKLSAVVTVEIEVNDDDLSLCGTSCPYLTLHPINPNCSYFKQGLSWKGELEAIQRCEKCIKLFNNKKSPG